MYSRARAEQRCARLTPGSPMRRLLWTLTSFALAAAAAFAVVVLGGLAPHDKGD